MLTCRIVKTAEFASGIMPSLEAWFGKRVKAEWRGGVDFSGEESVFRAL